MTEPHGRPALWMLGGAFCFAAMGATTHALGPRCDWLVIALVRVLIMFASTALMARAAGVRLVVFRPPTLWMRSLGGSFSLVGNFYALTRLPVADAITLSNTYPLWIFLVTAFALRQVPATAEALGMFSGLVGVVLIQRPHLGGDRFAVLVALLSSVSTAVAMMGLHRLRGLDPRAVVAHFAGVASLVAGTWLLLRRDAIAATTLDATTLLLLMGVGVTGTAGQYFLTRAYASGPPTQVAVIGLTQVIFALGFDVVLWRRSLTVMTLAGFVLVLAPTALLSGRAGRRLLAIGRSRGGRSPGVSAKDKAPEPEVAAPAPAE
jgi:drug/metabolite transporter (DMT)-like permease